MTKSGKWSWLTAGSSVAKSVKGLGAFATGLVSLFAALVALNVVNNPFDSPVDRLAKGGQELTDAGSAMVNISRVIRNGAKQSSDSGQGTLDFRGETGALDFSSGVRLILRRPYLYETAPALKGVWCEFDLTVLGPGFLWGALTGFQSDPGAAIRNLKEVGNSKKVGDELLFDVPVTHYSGQIDLRKLLDKTQDPQIRTVLRGFIAQNGRVLPVEAWLRKADDRILQLATRFNVPGKAYGRKGKVNVDAKFGFSHFGTAVSVKQPPPAKIAQPGERGCPAVP
jgi:hypothetical protein